MRMTQDSKSSSINDCKKPVEVMREHKVCLCPECVFTTVLEVNDTYSKKTRLLYMPIMYTNKHYKQEKKISIKNEMG